MSSIDKIKKEMDNKTFKLFVLSIIIIQVLTIYVVKSDLDVSGENVVPYNTVENSRLDSLQDVINGLQAQIEAKDEEFDEREVKYRDIISEYEIGIGYIKEYHNEAYRDFHRILSHKESFRREDEKENTERLTNFNIKERKNEKNTKKGFY